MILGLSIPAFTVLHVIISLLGIASGFVVVYGLWTGKALGAWTGFFLATTVLTSVTGFMFPLKAIGPPHIVGAISLVVLALAIAALHGFKLAGPWRWIYISMSVLALYLNAFVGVVQSFQKLPFLNALAPTQSTEPAFVIAQGLTFALFIWLGVVAVKRYRPGAVVKDPKLSAAA
jgi:hypothetical protein